jgi:superfamily II DNA/RNA helicase
VTSTTTFADFGVHEAICQALASQGISAPFPIQELTLPLALEGADIIGQARTGTGKTLAFGIPLLQHTPPDEPSTRALVIVPTRELCLQVRDDLAATAERLGTTVVAVYGGKAVGDNLEALKAGAPVVVGTPGRLLDLMQRGALDLSRVTSLVLDEADEMLDLGFLPDVERLIEATAAQRQTLLFSATMPGAVVALARRYMDKPTFLRAEVEEPRIAPETRQVFLSCHRLDKPAVLARILQAPERGLCVVFTRTKRMADVLAEELRGRDVRAAPIHSDLRQEARERALSRFRSGKIDVLVATEVAARGLDIDDVTHVVNYDCPEDEKMYLHRIGRTGRAGAAGVAVTLAVWNELARLEVIKKALDIGEPTYEVFSTSEILDELFDLPARPGRQPEAEAEAADDVAEPEPEPEPIRRRPARRQPATAVRTPPAPSVPGRGDGRPTLRRRMLIQHLP